MITTTHRRRIASLLEALVGAAGAHIALGEGAIVGSSILIGLAIFHLLDVMVGVARDV